jgi:hypothetical protein
VLLLLEEPDATLKQAAQTVALAPRHTREWVQRFLARGLDGLQDQPRPGPSRSCTPEVALRLVKLACKRPDDSGRSLAKWDCRVSARQLVAEGVVPGSSPDRVGRILNNHQFKPRRHHLWLSPKVPPNATFAAQVREVCTLFTRPLAAYELVLCIDEKTCLQARSHKWPTRSA